MSRNVLQFSKLPPPIGGVTIHVSRLIARGKEGSNLNLLVLDYSKEKNPYSIVKKISGSEIIHIHLSNKKARFLFTLLFKILRKKVVVTFHGKYDFESFFDKWSLKLSSVSIVLNEFSLINARVIRKNGVYKFGAFIPPLEENIEPIDNRVIEKIKSLKDKYKKVFCTNASVLAFDQNNREIYMGSDIVSYFSNQKKIALVFSNPDDAYYKFLKGKFKSIPDNIYFINEKHDFVNVIKETDGLIRATIKDGDSLSVKEALFYKKDVFATNVVDRPKGVITFSNFSDFDKKYNSQKIVNNYIKDNSEDIFRLYNLMLE